MNTHHGSISLEEAADVLDCDELTGEESLHEKCDNVFSDIVNHESVPVDEPIIFTCKACSEEFGTEEQLIDHEEKKT